MSEHRAINVLAELPRKSRWSQLPDEAVRLIRDRFFIEGRTLPQIQAELAERGHHTFSPSWIWKIARGKAYKDVEPSARLREWLRERNKGGKT